MFCATRNNSAIQTSDARDVSFTVLMNVFDSEGTEMRNACGIMVRTKACV